MPYVTGEGSTIYDIIEAMDSLLQTAGWVRETYTQTTYDGNTRTNYCIWRGSGDGNDKIYIQARIPDGNNQDMYLDSMAGYDNKLYYFEQPGSIQQWLFSTGKPPWGDGSSEVSQPMFTVTGDERFYYWLFADTYRIVGIARMSIVYESFHMGFLNPIASERQYPYPMYVCGNGVATGGSWPSNQTGSFVFPYNNSGYLRRADGTWRAFDASVPNPDPDSIGTVFPYNAHNELLVPNYKEQDAINQDNFLLLPIMLQTNDPIDINGLIRDVYWVSGTRDIASEQIIVYEGDNYMVFDTKQLRGSNTYFVVKMA